MRRPQKERSEQTRAALLGATINLIFERGLASTSMADVAAAAGVSRGALTHHFKSREELIASAVEQMLRIAIGELTDFAQRFLATQGSSDDIVDFLWDLMNRRLFLVTIEIMLEARHNATFLDSIRPVVSAWHQALDRIWDQLADRYGVDPEFARVLMNGTLCLIRGMIAQSIIRVDAPYYAALLDFWKRDVRAQLAMRRADDHAPRTARAAGASRR